MTLPQAAAGRPTDNSTRASAPPAGSRPARVIDALPEEPPRRLA
ncbi:hypothetical protein ACPCTK_08105 [Streptomyces pseudogriseolus]